MTKIQKVVLIMGCLWTALMFVMFVAKGLDNLVHYGGWSDPGFFFFVWGVPLALLWWPTGVGRHVVQWFNKE